MCFAFYFTILFLLLLVVMSVSSLACFDLVTSSMDFNFLWSDPCQCAQKVQAEQTLHPGVLSCCITHRRHIRGNTFLTTDTIWAC